MQIANPLYDAAFKYLMSNNRLAKKVLSVILDKEVLELELSQQEVLVENLQKQFTMYRLDFKALIRDREGKEEVVLIELQKSKLPTNVLRFRSYLSAAYAQKSKVVSEALPEYEVAYPIISIYIMGYNLPDIPVMAAKVDRKIIDLSKQEDLQTKGDFIARLPIPVNILQVRRLPKERRTRLEQFMTLFNQAWVKDERYILDLEEVPEGFEDVAKHLQMPLLDDKERLNLRAEQEVDNLFAAHEADIRIMEQTVERTRLQMETIQGEMHSMQGEMQSMQGEMHSMQETLSNTKETLQNTQETLHNTQEELKRKEEEAQALQRRQEEAQRRKEESQRQKEEAQRQKEEAQRQKEESQQRQEAAFQEAQEIKRKFAAILLQAGKSATEVAAETGLSVEAIKKLMK